MTKFVIFVMTAVCIWVAAYFALRAISSFKQDYSWQEMDWNQDGNTTIGEFFAASDIGKREVTQDGRKCMEYYAYKDGLSVKVVCKK